ncbi:hypothetical protein JCGZ_07878 [Jatropha curcas]|uniref:Uncharacterized protein n=1 Tax=Jatropha curcas TaxID=180498 RepID=A0A067KWM0_JATCU|nr:hypothetical protein JCGZ_07878 [Jatropha curcas]
MDRSIAPAFEALFCSFTHKDWHVLSPFELNGLSYYRNIRVQLRLLQWLIDHFDHSDNLFRHNDFEICPLFEEFSIISGRIPVTEEIPTLMRPLIDRALGMDCTSPHWVPLVCFYILSQYLLLNGIDGYGSLQLVSIVKQMARRHTPLPLILAEMLTWLRDHARDSSSVLSPMGSPLLLQALDRHQAVSDYTRFEGGHITQ